MNNYDDSAQLSDVQLLAPVPGDVWARALNRAFTDDDVGQLNHLLPDAETQLSSEDSSLDSDFGPDTDTDTDHHEHAHPHDDTDLTDLTDVDSSGDHIGNSGDSHGVGGSDFPDAF